MTRLEAIIAARTERRRRLAEAAAARALADLRPQGIDIRVFGSLASGDFRVHSDVDFLVHGPVDLEGRISVERSLEKTMRDSNLPYDLIYLDDLTADQPAAFRRG